MNLDQLAALADNASQLPWEGPGDVPYSCKAELAKAITPDVALALIAVCRAADAYIHEYDESGGRPLSEYLGKVREALAALEAMNHD